METLFLDGKALKSMLIGAANKLKNNVEYINELNVFPVPDGDTGINMCKTLEGGIYEIMKTGMPDVATVSDVISKFSRGALLGARGNSGVILSQIFAGIAEGLSGLEKASSSDLAYAYRKGVEKSYSSVSNPVEGTILTVFREATEYAAARVNDGTTVEDFLSAHRQEVKRSLQRTKDILPQLKEADVVDSGGAGYLAVADGMYSSLTGEETADSYELTDGANTNVANIDAFTRESVLEFGYCTEFLLRLQSAKVDPDSFDVSVVTDFLKSIGGDSIVSYKTGDVVKVHVHTENPGAVLTKAREWGEMLTVKIENMSVQHNESEEAKPQEPHKEIAVIAVASGDGMSELFTSVGADKIISGGQTQNPSTEQFLDAFREVNAEKIVVLPNNKNILLTAKQAAELFDKSEIYIIPTKTLMQGYAALSAMVGEEDAEEMVALATDAAECVIDAEITYAVRDANVGGVCVKKGEYMAISASAIKSTAQTPELALVKMLESLEELDEREIISVFAGKDVTDENRAALAELLTEKYPDHEVMFYVGGQEIYSYLLAIE